LQHCSSTSSAEDFTHEGAERLYGLAEDEIPFPEECRRPIVYCLHHRTATKENREGVQVSKGEHKDKRDLGRIVITFFFGDEINGRSKRIFSKIIYVQGVPVKFTQLVLPTKNRCHKLQESSRKMAVVLVGLVPLVQERSESLKSLFDQFH
jgi:hypothetical protein